MLQLVEPSFGEQAQPRPAVALTSQLAVVVADLKVVDVNSKQTLGGMKSRQNDELTVVVVAIALDWVTDGIVVVHLDFPSSVVAVAAAFLHSVNLLNEVKNCYVPLTERAWREREPRN